MQYRPLRQHRAARGTTRSARDPSAAGGLRTPPQDDIVSSCRGCAPAPYFVSANIAFWYHINRIISASLFQRDYFSNLFANRGRFCHYSSRSFLYSRIPQTPQSRILQRSLTVTVVIGLLCLRRSIRPLLMPYVLISLYVVNPFSFNVLKKGSYEIIIFTPVL